MCAMSRIDRDNPDLDDFMADTEPGARKKRRKRRASVVKADDVRRRAFRVLAVLADLDAKTRDRILRKALALSKA